MAKKAAIFAIFLCLASLCSAPARSELVDRIVAVVNNDIIRLSDLNEVLEPYMEKLKEAGYSPEKEREWMYTIREEALNGLIDRKLVDQEIAELKIKVDDKEVDALIEQIKKEQRMTDEELREALAREGETLESFRKARHEEMLRSRLMDLQVTSRVVITDEEVKRTYEEDKQHYGGQESLHLILLLAPLEADASQAESDQARKTLADLSAAVADGKAFTQAVQDALVENPALEKSDLGFFEVAELTEEIQKVVSGKGAGDVSPLRETDQGLSLIYISEVKKTPDVPIERAAPEIKRKIYSRIVNEKYKQWLSDLRKRSFVKIIR